MNFVRSLATRILGVEMFVTLPRLVLMACLLIPSLSWGLGLGEIHLNSALNEPMNAEIDLIAAGPEARVRPRRIVGALNRFDSRTLCDFSSRGQLGPRAPDA